MSSRSLGSLTIDLIAKIAGFERGMSQAARIAEDRSKRINKAMGTISRNVLAMGAGFLSIRGIITGTLDAINRADELGTMAESFGTNVEALSRLDYAAKQSNTSLEALTSGFAALQKNLVLASEDSGKAQKALAALGIDADRLKRIPLPQQIDALAEAFAKVSSPAERMRIAAELFGKEIGLRMLPLLAQGKDGLKALGEEADRLGATLTTEGVEKLRKADEAMKKFSATTAGLKTQLAILLTPAIEAAGAALEKFIAPQDQFIFKWLQNDLIETERFLKAFNIQLEQGSEKAILLARGLSLMDRYNKNTGPSNPRGGFFGPLIEGAEETEKAVKRTAAELEQLERFMNQGRQMSIDASRIQQPLANAGSFDEADAITQDINRHFEEVRRNAGGLADDVGRAGAVTLEVIEDVNAFAAEATRNVQDLLGGFLENFALTSKFNFDKLLRDFGNLLVRMSAQALAADIAGKIFGKAGVGSGSGFSGFFSSLFGLFGKKSGGSGPGYARAAGGPVTAGTSYVVGEHGPEMFTPSVSGKIVPNDALGSIVVNQHMDNRGASGELIRALPGILKANNERLMESLRDARKRGI